jgi:tripartite-type tricarboxylate transporter receptor subunit TctC
MPMRTLRLLLLAVLSLLPASALAQDWPARTVKFIVPFPPAGATDIAARIISDKLTKALGQTFVVENKPGAAGIVGMEVVVRAPADD